MPFRIKDLEEEIETEGAYEAAWEPPLELEPIGPAFMKVRIDLDEPREEVEELEATVEASPAPIAVPAPLARPSWFARNRKTLIVAALAAVASGIVGYLGTRRPRPPRRRRR